MRQKNHLTMRTHLGLVPPAQLLGDHALHPHVEQPERRQHAIGLARRNIARGPIDRLPSEDAFQKYGARGPRPQPIGHEVYPCHPLLHMHAAIARRRQLVERERPHRPAPKHPKAHAGQSHPGIAQPPSTRGCAQAVV